MQDKVQDFKAGAIIGCFAVGFLGIGIVILMFFGFNFGITKTGSVTAIDCKATETFSAGDWGTYFHKFYCTGGFCEAADFNSEGKCMTDYYYSTK